MKMTSWHSRAHTHTREHMGRTHQIIIFIQIQNNQRLLLPIHTVKIHICNTHTTHTCVNKVYSKCFGIFAYVHEPVCMRCIQNYSVDSFVSTAANKLCWILGFGWMLFFPFCEPVWPHKFVKRIQRNVFPFCPSCLFLLLWVSCN